MKELEGVCCPHCDEWNYILEDKGEIQCPDCGKLFDVVQGRERYNRRTNQLMKVIGQDRAQEIRRDSYQEYLKTERWKTLAEACKASADYSCKICGSSDNLEAHHRSYDNLRKPQEILDLVCLCHTCHQKFHEIIK